MTSRYTPSEAETDVGAAFEAGAASATPIPVLHVSDQDLFVMAPKGWQPVRLDVDDVRANPRWAVAHPTFDDQGSFAAYCARYWEEGASLIFATRAGAMRAIFDYHESESAGGTPGRGDHTARFTPRFTRSWNAWTGADDVDMSQSEFLQFLEERIGDIASPDGAELQEVIRFFTVKSAVGFSSAQNLTNGTVQLTWTEDAEAGGGAGGQQQVPTGFTVMLKPFMDRPETFAAQVRLRWRLSKPRVTFRFILPEAVSDFVDEVNEARRVELSATLNPILFGNPA